MKNASGSNAFTLVNAGGAILGGDPRNYRKGAKYSAPEFGMYSTATDLAAFYNTMRAGGVHMGNSASPPPRYVLCHNCVATTPAPKMLSAIKLDRLGYVEKSIEQEQQGYGEFYAFRATDDGTDILLKNEERIFELSRPAPRARGGYGSPPKTVKSTGFDDMDDDIPF